MEHQKYNRISNIYYLVRLANIGCGEADQCSELLVRGSLLIRRLICICTAIIFSVMLSIYYILQRMLFCNEKICFF